MFTPEKAENTFLSIEGTSAIRILKPLGMKNSSDMEHFENALRSLIEKGANPIEIDFSQAQILSSSIISLAFFAVHIAQASDVRLVLKASMTHHRPLVSAGMTNYVDLRLCG